MFSKQIKNLYKMSIAKSKANVYNNRQKEQNSGYNGGKQNENF